MYTLNETEVHAVCYGIDQQGGNGGANYLKDICPTILSDSHGTPHAVACIGVDLYNQALTGGGVEDLECNQVLLRPCAMRID
jgi:hypothetical protein